MMSETLLLTFLGTGNYKGTRYRIGDSVSAEEVYFSVALAEHLRPDRVVTLETAEANEKHGGVIAEAFRKHCIPHQKAGIPAGASERELWEIFSMLAGQVPEGCKLHLDITHGFRSLPLLGFIAISYLRVTRKISMGGLHYGAWEARDRESNIAPAFNLTPFVTLLDWTVAADEFLHSGSAVRLGGLLEEKQQSLWTDADRSSASPDRDALPKKLKSLGSSVSTSSLNLLLLRTGAMAESAGKLEVALESARAELTDHAAPFLEVLRPVSGELTRFRDTELSTLRELVSWLADHGRTAAALTLASEWTTSYAMVHYGKNNHHSNHKSRKPYSQAIFELECPGTLRKSDDPGRKALEIAEQLKRTLAGEHIGNLASATSKIRSARNDLNHAGFSDEPAKASDLIKRAKEIAEILHSLPLP